MKKEIKKIVEKEKIFGIDFLTFEELETLQNYYFKQAERLYTALSALIGFINFINIFEVLILII